MEYVHCPVMKEEVLNYLIPQNSDALMVDCTTGEGGHTSLFLEKYPNLKVIGLDRDKEIQKRACIRLEKFGSRFQPVNTWFDEYWENYDGQKVDLILFDLGISVFHYQISNRGFSFKVDEELDMRLDASSSLSAKTIVNKYRENDIADLIFKYGEERYSRRIASAIVEARKEKEIETTEELASIVWKSVPAAYRHKKNHPATKTFQAIRIEVNKELDRISPALENAMKALKPGGIIGVITFHSLEDRIVKWKFREHDNNDNRDIEILTKKPLVPSEEECKTNPPSRSAKLRVAKKR